MKEKLKYEKDEFHNFAISFEDDAIDDAFGKVGLSESVPDVEFAEKVAAEMVKRWNNHGELLEALKDMVGNVVAHDQGYVFIKRARAAIAKATPPEGAV